MSPISDELSNLNRLRAKAAELLKVRRYVAAEDILRKIAAADPSRENMLALARNLRNGGHQLAYDGQYEAAKLRLREAEALFARLGEITEIYKLRVACGRCESALGNYNEALKIFKNQLRCLKIRRYPKHLTTGKKSDDGDLWAKIHYYLSIVYAKKNLWKEALTEACQARVADRGGYYGALSLMGEGVALAELKKYSTAIRKLSAARLFFAASHPYRTAIVDENIARCLHRLGRYKEALALLDRCVKIYKNCGIERSWVYFHRAVTKDALNRYNDAGKDYKKAVQLVETGRREINADVYRRTYFAQKLVIYDYAVSNALARGDGEAAFNYAQSAKSRNFNELVELAAESRPVLSPRDDEKLSKHLTLARKKLDAAYSSVDFGEGGIEGLNRLKKLQRQYTYLLHEIEQRNPRLAEMTTHGALSSAQIREILAPDDVFVEYYSTGENLTIFCVDKKNGLTVAVSDFPRDKLASAVAQSHLWAAKCEISDRESERKARAEGAAWYARQLYELLLAPIKKRLAGARRLIFAPHLALHYLPFAALMDTDSKLLVEKFEIATVPSARIFKKSAGASCRAALKSLIVADTAGDLRYAASESNKIAEILPSPAVLSGRSATKDAIIAAMPSADIIHFACHAHACPENSLFSGIVTASSDGGIAVIESNEILRMRIPAMLVFLCGCSTGIGDIHDGDEITSLTRAFMIAGSTATLYTLWNVADESASSFARLFYDCFVNKGMSKTAALRNAQLKMLSDGRSAYHWAPFAIAGI